MELGAQFHKEDVPAKRSKRLKKLRLMIPAAVLLVGAAFGVRYYLGLPEDDALRLSDVGTEVGGRVQSIAVREGDRVSQGQVIAQLEGTQAQAQQAAAERKLAQVDRDRYASLLQEGVISQQQFESEPNPLRNRLSDPTGASRSDRALDI